MSIQRVMHVLLVLVVLAVPASLALAESLPYGVLQCGHLGEGRENQGPAAAAICQNRGKTPKEKELWAEALRHDMYVVGAYRYVASLLPQGSAQWKALNAAQARYYDERDACGQDLACILRVEKRRHEQLHAQRDRLEQPLPVEAIARLTRGWKTTAGEGLTRRVLEGFGIQPLRRVTLAHGDSVVWGFVPHAANVQSMALLDPKGEVKAIVTADGVYLNQGEPGKVAIYLPRPQGLTQILPTVRSWVAASYRGFDVDCSKDRAACEHPRVPVSLQAYDLRCTAKTAKQCALPVPTDTAPGPAVDLFTQ
ncbi:hypothetical protein [Candidatus Igneacidithiobacillus taiwanensis]|uniref:hypothetical protein n=1 Tax=Candidatus Igneacidithiobacillus taiwanensis TaxID=1945924 RepID=UPI00289D7D2D|nr:hypothetical protein [Candidatus Igneacidithiobacillus taiwanensis]